MWWLLLPALLIAFLCVLLLRAARFKPHEASRPDAPTVNVDVERAVESLQRMIRCKTVSYRDKALENPAEFTKFQNLLNELYPRLHETCTLDFIGARGLLYHWRGKSSQSPTVLMAHYDVVPADEAAWAQPVFEGLLIENEIWGRGALDTKCTLCSALEAAEALIVEGFTPENDVYFAFGGDEEIAGGDAPAIVEALRTRNIVPALVLDEGGAVVEGVFPGVGKRCALIGTGEKGMMNIEFKVESAGGHASSPPRHTPVGLLAQAVVKVENTPFPYSLTTPVSEMFDTLGRHSTFFYRFLFANLWCFSPLLNAICKKSGGELNALVRTTCAFTMMDASPAINVLPPSARIGANLRLVGGQTVQSVRAHIEKAIANDRVQLRAYDCSDPSPFSRTDSAGYACVRATIEATWPDAIVSPYLMIACSDSRHFCRISDNVFRFSAMALSSDDRKRIHGHDERIEIEKLHEAVQFYTRLIKLI